MSTSRFGDGVHVGVNVECGVAAVVHDAGAVQLPVVVLGAAAVHAVLHAAGDSGLTFVLPGLVDDAGRKRDQLGEVAAVQAPTA